MFLDITDAFNSTSKCELFADHLASVFSVEDVPAQSYNNLMHSSNSDCQISDPNIQQTLSCRLSKAGLHGWHTSVRSYVLCAYPHGTSSHFV